MKITNIELTGISKVLFRAEMIPCQNDLTLFAYLELLV